MKQKDLVIIIVVVVFAAIFSLVIGKLVFASPKDRLQKVEVVEAITTEFPAPDTKYFNTASINPTLLIRIAENSNQTPFNTNNQ